MCADHARGRRVAAGATLALALATGGLVAAQVPEPASGPCAIRESGRFPIKPDSSTELYVEPRLLVAGSGGRTLLAGTHNHLFRRAAAGQWVRAGGEEIFGAVIDANAAVGIVPSPIPTSAVVVPRAVARGDDAWSVVFLEAAREGQESDSRDVRGLWHAELRGVEWSGLERVPVPAGRVEVYSPSSLLLHDGSLTWAVVVRTAAGLYPVVVLQRGESGWSYHTVPTHFAGELDVARGRDGRLLLAVVQPDLTLPRDGNSLFLWRLGETWTSLGKLVASQREAAKDPALVIGAQRDVLSWGAVPAGAERLELHAMADPEQVPRPPILTVDAQISGDSPIAPVRVGREFLFVTDHVLEGDEREIRFSRLAQSDVQLVSAVRHGFIANFAATATDDSTVVVVGGRGETAQNVLALYPNYYLVPSYSAIYSEMLRFRTTCAPNRR